MATIKLKRGLESKVPSLPKEDGSLIFGYNTASVPATMQLDQSINGTVQRLNLSVANSGTSSYAKNSGALGGSSLSQVLAQAGSGNAFTGIDTATNNVVKLTRANGGTVQKVIDNVSHATSATISSTSNIAKNSNALGGSSLSQITNYINNKDIKVTQLSNQDLNTIKTPGFYYAGGGNSCTNKPSNVDSFGLEVIRIAAGYYAQRLTVSSTNSDFSNTLYTRYYNASTWTSWTNTFKIKSSSASTADISKNSNALGGSSLSQILNSITSGSVIAETAIRLATTTKSVANNFTIRTGIPTSSGWSQHPAYHLYNTSDADLTAYKGKSVSLLHMDGGAQRHDIVALNSANDGLLYATASSTDGSARIERILDGGNYGSLITNLSKQVTFSNGLKAQKNVQMDGGNFSSGSTVTTRNGETTIPNVHFSVSGKTLIITTK